MFKIGAMVHTLSFSDDGSHIRTVHERFDLNGTSLRPFVEPAPLATTWRPTFDPYNIFREYEWIISRKHGRLLWLHPDYRPTTKVVCDGDGLFWGCLNGVLQFVRFDLEHLPLDGRAGIFGCTMGRGISPENIDSTFHSLEAPDEN